jgi:hypothetical protein
MGPMIAEEPTKLKVQRQTSEVGQHRLEQTERGTMQHMGWPVAGTF